MRQISVVEDPGAAVEERLSAVAQEGGHLVLTGGSTPRRAYGLAAERDADWSRATVWFSDERCVPPDDENSNFGMADRALLSRLSRPPRVMRIEGELGHEAQIPRVTLTFPVLNAARQVDVLVTGADKADAVARGFGDPPDPDAPASRVRPAGSLCVYLDEAAAGRL